MRSLHGISSVAWRVSGAAAFVAALSFAPLPVRFNAPVCIDCDRDLALRLPAAPIAVLEARGLGSLARGFLGGAVHARLLALDAWQSYARTPEYGKLLAGLAVAELAAGLAPCDLAAALLGTEAVAAFVIDGGTPGLVAAVRVGDPEVAQQIVRGVRALAAMNREAAVPAHDFEFAGVSGVVVNGKLWLAADAGDLVAASSEALMHGALAREIVGDAPPERSAPPSLVLRLRAAAAPTADVAVALDVAKAKALKPDAPPIPARADHFLTALLFGDLLHAAGDADVLALDLTLRGETAHVALRIPSPARERPAFLRAFGHARAAEPLAALAPDHAFLTLLLRRDGARFWDDRGELCDASTEKEFADLKTGLGLFLGGRSLPDEVLPQLDDEIAFVLARQTYPGASAPPAVRFPAGALIWRTHGDAAPIGRMLAVGVHSFVAAINLGSAQERKTPLLPFVEEFEGVVVYGGRALATKDRPIDDTGRNLSPCAAWTGDRIVLASSEELLHDVLHCLRAPATAAAGAAAPSAGCTGRLELDGVSLAALLREDRATLVANKVADDGKTHEEAEREIDLLTGLCGWFERVTLAETVHDDALEVALDFVLTPDGAASETPGSPASPATSAAEAAARGGR